MIGDGKKKKLNILCFTVSVLVQKCKNYLHLFICALYFKTFRNITKPYFLFIFLDFLPFT